MVGAEFAIGVTVLGFFLTPNITKLMEVARDFAYSEYKLYRGMAEKLLKLEEDLGDIKCLLGPGTPATTGGFVNDPNWLNRLWRLKDAIHDVEEILDLFESHILELEAAKNLKKRRGSKKSTDTSSSKAPSLGQLKKVLNNLEELRNKVWDLTQNSKTMSVVLSPIPGRSAGMGQDPVRNKKLFFGYDNEYEKLVSMLRAGHTEKKVIAIIGHGGMGKTELARQAFRDVKSEFNLLIWVPAYGKMTEFDVLKEILKSTPGSKSGNEMNISSLMIELKELLSPKKFLLVFDDVWNDECATSELEREQAWKALRSFVGNGSKIVMTTRAKICSTTLCADASIVLNGIKPKDITLLVNDTAELRTDGTTRRDQQIQKLLNKQVLKFKGSPLAAVEIGLELKKPNARDTQCKILQNIEYHIVSVFKGHLFTYHHLPPHLQRCFAFCSIFPYSWRFDPDKLTKMWIALGFVEENANPLDRMNSVENIARGYFDSLVDRSLFQLQEACSSMGEGGKHYVIHEQIHWMLRLVSAKNCISIHGSDVGSSKRSIPATVRHLSVTSGCLDRLNEHSIGLSNLRTLLVLKDNHGTNPAPSIDKTILRKFKGVRVLDLTETGITQLPENIGKLQHVRYLGLPGTISSNLCDQVTKLLFLQTLTVGAESKTEKKRVCITNISGIGRLVKLRESIEFHVMRESEKEGQSLWELARMNSQRGTLSIKGLDAVASMKEAEEACLANKVDIDVLKLEWEPQAPVDPTGGPAAANLALAVLKGLKPPSNLKVLRITRYHGATSPKWLSGMNTLTHLYLRNCRNLQALPAVGGLPCLELLNIKELNSVSRIGSNFCGGGVFPELKQIVLEDMPKLVAWDRMPENALHKLTKVRIVDCPCLSSLSGLEYRVGLHLRIERCTSITQVNLPSNFSNGGSTCTFE